MFRRLAVVAALLRLAACLPEDEAAVSSDVKYIRCGLCQQLITAVHESVTAARKKSKAKRLSEESIQMIIESACNPSTEAGAWLKFLDMTETDGGKIQIERQAEDGPCGRECRTLGMACEQLMEEGWEDTLSESLFGGEAADELRETACREWSGACRKSPPKVDQGRRAGPAFRPFTEDERALEAYRTGAPAAPGVFQDEALRYALGVGAAGDVDDVAFTGAADFDGGLSSHLPSVGGDKPLHEDLARMDAFVSLDEM